MGRGQSQPKSSAWAQRNRSHKTPRKILRYAKAKPSKRCPERGHTHLEKCSDDYTNQTKAENRLYHPCGGTSWKWSGCTRRGWSSRVGAPCRSILGTILGSSECGSGGCLLNATSNRRIRNHRQNQHRRWQRSSRSETRTNDWLASDGSTRVDLGKKSNVS